jgi:hypothetical protein
LLEQSLLMQNNILFEMIEDLLLKLNFNSLFILEFKPFF